MEVIISIFYFNCLYIFHFIQKKQTKGFFIQVCPENKKKPEKTFSYYFLLSTNIFEILSEIECMSI